MSGFENVDMNGASVAGDDHPQSDWTPSTEQVRSHYVFDQSDRWDAERGKAFDRWIAAERASWLAEYLLSDESVEKAARAVREEDRPRGWDGLNEDQRAANDAARMPGYRILVRAALQAVLGKPAAKHPVATTDPSMVYREDAQQVREDHDWDPRP